MEQRGDSSDIETALLPVLPTVQPARYVLQPGLNIVADDQGGVLVSYTHLDVNKRQVARVSTATAIHYR